LLQVMEHVRAFFRPEFLNRLDEIILFHRLSRKHIKAIVEIQLEHLRKSLALQNIGFEYDELAVDWLAEKGYDPTFGARPLKRLIQREIQNNLAKMLLGSQFSPNDIIKITAKDGELVIS